MNTSITLLQQENIQSIAQNAPVAFQKNQAQHDKCITMGQDLLSTIQQGGMTDDLDRQAAEFIDKSRICVRWMNDQRSPVTKLFDEMRSAYTRLENEVNPTYNGSIPYLLQQERNKYAAQKREEAERIRREQERQREVENQKVYFEREITNKLSVEFDVVLNYEIERMSTMFTSATLDGIKQTEEQLKEIDTKFTQWKAIEAAALANMSKYQLLSREDKNAIYAKVKNQLQIQFSDQYTCEISSNRDEFLEMLPSKKKELEAIAKASTEEAERRKQEMQQREAEEAARREADRLRKEQEAQAKVELERQQAEAVNLFNQAAAATPTYQAKTSVKKKIEILSQQGILDCLNMWWLNEGMNLSVEELQKKFKSQITFCEKLANDKTDPKFIDSNNIAYIEEVKAK